MRKSTLCAIFIVTALFGTPSSAVLVGDPDIPSLIAASDLVVVGKVTSTVLHKSIDKHGEPAFSERFSVSIDRVLMGKISNKSLWVSTSDGGTADQTYGIFFLHGSSNGDFAPADPNFYQIAGVPGTDKMPDVPSNPTLAVTLELTRVLATAPEALPRFVGEPPGPEEMKWTYQEAAGSIATVPKDIARGPLSALMSSHSAFTRLWAMACLFHLGDLTFLNEAVPDLLADDVGFGGAAFWAGQALADPGLPLKADMIPALTELLKSSNLELRRGAAAALRHIGTNTVIRPLALVALIDGDKWVREQAELGLCEATKTTMPPCRTGSNEEIYRVFWERWADTNVK